MAELWGGWRGSPLNSHAPLHVHPHPLKSARNATSASFHHGRAVGKAANPWPDSTDVSESHYGLHMAPLCVSDRAIKTASAGSAFSTYCCSEHLLFNLA